MISALNIIRPEQPFNHELTGYFNNHIPGSPIANGSRLLPFYSMPFDPAPGVIITAQIRSICGSYTVPWDELPYIEKNNTWTFYHDGSLTELSLDAGYWYIYCEANVLNDQITQDLIAYIDRAEADGGSLESERCLELAAQRLTGEDPTIIPLFKSEPFYMPHPSELPEEKGDFNKDFNSDFYV